MSQAADVSAPIVAGRSCAGCTLCCKLLSISELAKPQQSWCPSCTVGVGCRIYADRPGDCADFHCGWLVREEVGDAWRPSECGMVLNFEALANRVIVHVDQRRPEAWRQEPYFSQIKRWAVEAAQNRGQVIVWEGLELVAILPDREKRLGRIGDDQLIITSERRTPEGVERDMHLMHRDDPRLAGRPLETHVDA